MQAILRSNWFQSSGIDLSGIDQAMAMSEDVISLQSKGLRRIPPRPSAVQQEGWVLVVLDVNKAVAPAAVYWVLGNVVRKGDHLKILGIITHIPNPMGFMVRVEPQSTRNSPNIMELQFEIATKKEAIWRTAYVKEWCEKAGVKLDVDVKAGNNPKVIATDEAKAISAYHVILDKSMKKDRKYFVDSLSCSVSRICSSGGVDSLRSFAMSNNNINKLPPTTLRKSSASNNSGSMGSTASSGASSSSYRRGSSMSWTSFELGGESSDEVDPITGCAPDDSLDPQPSGVVPWLTIRTHPQTPNQLHNFLRSGGVPVLERLNSNPLRKPAVRKWLQEDESLRSMSTNISSQPTNEQPLTPRTEFRFKQGPGRQGPQIGNNGTWIGQPNVVTAPEFATLLQTQASVDTGRPTGRRKDSFRADQISMDMHWPLMHWVDCRAMKLRFQSATSSSSTRMLSSSSSSLNNLRARRRMPSGLNYSDMVDSD